MKTITLKKEDFLYKYPDIFAKLVWIKELCVVTVHFENDDKYKISSAGAFGLVDIPKDALLKKCEQCGKPLGPRRKRFCSNKCKDHYHNIHNPRGYYAPGTHRGYYAPGNPRDIIPQGFPTNLTEMIRYKAHIADMRADEEDCGDKPYT